MLSSQVVLSCVSCSLFFPHPPGFVSVFFTFPKVSWCVPKTCYGIFWFLWDPCPQTSQFQLHFHDHIFRRPTQSCWSRIWAKFGTLTPANLVSRPAPLQSMAIEKGPSFWISGILPTSPVIKEACPCCHKSGILEGLLYVMLSRLLFCCCRIGNLYFWASIYEYGFKCLLITFEPWLRLMPVDLTFFAYRRSS